MKNQTLQDMVNILIAKEQKLYEKADIGRLLFINFPNKKNLFLKRIAVWILNKNGAVIDTKYFNLKQK